MKRYLSDDVYAYWPLCSIYWKMLHDGAANLCKATFYKYAKLMGFTQNRHKIRKERYPTGIRASEPLHILHTDVTQIRTSDGSRVFISLVVDNFSRAILGWKAASDKTSGLVLGNLREVVDRYRLADKKPGVDLMVDDGSENKGEVTGYLSHPGMNIKLVVAQQPPVLYSNSMVESIIKKLKYEFLFTQTFADFKELSRSMQGIVDAYNSRPLDKLAGYSPMAVLAGAKPNPGMFADRIKAASEARIEQNKGLECKKCMGKRHINNL